jgi:putative endonuclease
MNFDGKPTYYVYIMSNNAGITYIGVTNNISRRVEEHKTGKLLGFTKRNRTHKLVYYEEHQYVHDAIYREKQIKTWRKEKKRDLITFLNPKWKDLSAEWLDEASHHSPTPRHEEFLVGLRR